ncbi:MAG TPA: N-acetylmuramoyl-L-alanine amidase, partial [Actinomycetospora sp.]|nr:N-acetylmuramoyl-L-alanine amidase [Actinomycetospora sp.]
MAVRKLFLLPVLVVLLAACGVAEPPAPSPPSVAAPLPGARSAPPSTTAPAGPAPVVVLDPGHNGGNAAAADEIAREVPDGRGGTKPCNTTGTETADG